MAKTTKKEVKENIVNEVENVMDANTEMNQEMPRVEFTPLSFDELKEKIIVTESVGIVAKQMIVDVVYNSCVKLDNYNGVYYIDHIMKNVAYNFATLEQYTDFYNVVENATEYTYEYLKQIGLFDYVKSVIYKDVEEVDDMIYDFPSRVMDLNSVGSCVYRLIGEGIKNMPKLDVAKVLKDLPSVINGIDKDIIKTVVGEFKNGNGGNIIKMANAQNK